MQSNLGSNTNLVSPEKSKHARNERLALKEHAGALLPGERVSWCLHRLQVGAGENFFQHSASKQKASYTDIALCGSIWQCPVCSLKISEIRREEIKKALEHSSKLLPVMLTLTVQHHAGEPLADLVDALKDAWRKLKSGKAWLTVKERFKIKHYVSAFEIRHGSAGWHPHIHVLAFLELSESEFQPGALKDALLPRYKSLLAKHGRYILDEYGLHVKSCNGQKELGEYLSKLSMQFEISKSASKIGRDEESFSPFQLLAQSMAGDENAGRLFVEYAKTMAGRKFLQWSRGARDFFALDAELTDEELASLPEQEPDDTRKLIRFPKSGWYKVCRARLPERLLIVGSSGDVGAIVALLEFHKLRRGLDFEVMDE